MLHELLLALQGFPGSIFVSGEEGIKVVKGLPFIHPCEETVLDNLCLLATHYKYLQEFQSQQSFDTVQKTDSSNGLYLRAFCSGLHRVLDPYCQDLLSLEEEILRDPHISLTHFQHKLDKYHLLFPVLIDLLEHINKHKVHGCRLLDLVYKYSASGIPLVTKALKKLLHGCHIIMFRQLTAWMLYGTLMDPYREFFIQKVEQNAAGNILSHEELLTSAVGATSKKDDGNLIHNKEEKTEPQILERFRLEPDLLPSYIPSHLADKILFIGKSVSVFGKSNYQYRPIWIDVYHFPDSESMFEKREDHFAQLLFELQQEEEFSLPKFESVVDEIRSCAAEHLWRVVVEEADLMAHLRLIKDFFLLGRGELFLAFIDDASAILRVPVTSTMEHDVNMAFQLASRRVLPDDSVAEKFYITVQAKGKGSISGKDATKSKIETGWSRIGMAYEVPWPLHVLLTPSVLNRYSTVFQFLLAVRRVQQELHQCWATQMCNKGVGRESAHVPLWQLRIHMSFLIDNLQYYLQVDVMESQFSELVEKVKSVKDFEAIQHAHEQFLTSVISQSFLLLKPVYLCVQEILDTCLTFCALMSRAQAPLGQRDLSQLNGLITTFRHHTFLLFRILSAVRSHQVSPHLAQLLLRIDYNKYFSSSGGFLGGNSSDGTFQEMVPH